MLELVVTAWLGTKLVGVLAPTERFQYGDKCVQYAKDIIRPLGKLPKNKHVRFQIECSDGIGRHV
jgi:hypothetical protein